MSFDRDFYFKLACSATRNMHQDFEKTADRFVNNLEDDIKKLEEVGVEIAGVNKYISSVRDWWAAYGKCASPMVTGPANFPVERNRKAHEAVNKKTEISSRIFKKLIDSTKPKVEYTQEDEIKRLRECAASACWASERRRYTMAADKLEEELKKGDVEEVLPSGTRIVEDKKAMRLRIYTVGKPAPEVIELLKDNAFKWAPSIKAWQRQLTDNARAAFNFRIKQYLQGKDWPCLGGDILYTAVKHFDKDGDFDYWGIKNAKGKIIEKYS